MGIKRVQLVDKKLIKKISDVYLLTAEQAAKLERMGEKSAQNLIAAIEKSKNPFAAKFLHALGIRHISERTAQILVENFGSLENLMKVRKEDLEAIDGIGPEIAESVVRWKNS